ncbi:MAG: hypothetical protein JXA61_04535 [Bacteroidales bacterium]|nr:hypothetical protein [Bacteroidales bacterium]
MAKLFLTYQRIMDYLKGLLSNNQRHELEKEVMRDAFEEEAFEGLNLLTSDELEADMNLMEGRLADRIRKTEKPILHPYLRIAASLVLFAGLGSVLYFLLMNRPEELKFREIAQEQSVERSVEEDKNEALPSPEPPVVEQEPHMNIPVQPLENTNVAKAENPDEFQAANQESEEKPKEILYEPSAAKIPKTTEVYEAREPDEVKEMRSTEMAGSREQDAVNKPPAATFMNVEDKRLETAAVPESFPSSVLTARMVDQEGNAFPGVAILETATGNKTITDQDGKFSLEMFDPDSSLALRYLGFREIKITGDEIPGYNFMMQEAVLTLEEMVLVSYQASEKADITGKVSATIFDKRSKTVKSVIELTGPVPPGGSLRAYKKLVETSLDHEKLNDLPGKYRIVVTLSVQQDGQVTSINIHKDIPTPIAEEYKRCIAEIQPWQAASEGGIPVEARVEIRFDLNVK